MTYAKDLDEYDTQELEAELKRRAKLTKKGRCTYCKKSVDAPACRFPERHSKKSKIKTPEIVVGDTIYELTEAFCLGAIAFHNDVPYNVGNPYDDEDDRNQEWSDGHGIASGDEEQGVSFSLERAEKALKEARARRL